MAQTISKEQQWKTRSIVEDYLAAIDREKRKQFVAAIGGKKDYVTYNLLIKPILKET